jgi:hypothetical protein
MCTLGDFYADDDSSAEFPTRNDFIRVSISRFDAAPRTIDFYLVQGLKPHVRVSVEPLRGEWSKYPSNFPLLAVIRRQLVLDLHGQKFTLVLATSFLKPSRLSTRVGIPVSAIWNEVEKYLADENDAMTLDYLFSITKLHVAGMEDEPCFRSSLSLMPNITYAVVNVDWINNLDFGLDTLPMLRNLRIFSSKLKRREADFIAKFSRLNRLHLDDVREEADLDALCDMFSALPHLWFLNVNCFGPKNWISLITSSEKLRHAMRNLKHVVAFVDDASNSVDVFARLIETLSQLENVTQITLTRDFIRSLSIESVVRPVSFKMKIAAARAKARKLRSSRLRIEIIE